MIIEGVDALKGAIRPLSLDCPLIAVTEDNVKDRLLRAIGDLGAIAIITTVWRRSRIHRVDTKWLNWDQVFQLSASATTSTASAEVQGRKCNEMARSRPSLRCGKFHLRLGRRRRTTHRFPSRQLDTATFGRLLRP